MPFDEDYYKSEDFRELLDSYERAVESGSHPFMDADDLVDIADYYNMNGDYDKANRVVDHALELYPEATLPNVFKARQALQEGDYELARDYADDIEHKDDPDYHYLVAEIMIAEGNIEQADRYLRDYGLTVDADEYEDYVRDCANLYIDYGISDKAYEWMMRSKGDDSTDFKELMARTLFGLGKYKDSQRIFNELLDKDPYSKQYWNALASAQFMNKEYDEAVTSSEYVLAIDPKDPEGLLNKAQGLLQLGNYEEALKLFDRFCDLVPEEERPFNPADLMVIRGHVQLEKGLVDEAETSFREAINISDGAPDILLRIIVSLYDNRYIHACYEMLKNFFSVVGQMQPDFNEGYSYMVLCCYDLGYTREFMHYLKLACEKNPYEAQNTLAFLFPEGMEAEDYYAYMKERLNINMTK